VTAPGALTCPLCHELSVAFVKRGDDFMVCVECASIFDRVAEIAVGDVIRTEAL
jgi:hypothetical protein